VFDKLRQIESRYEELATRLAEAANASGGRAEYARLAKAAAEIEPVVTAF
jgi:protein subunit release factor A